MVNLNIKNKIDTTQSSNSIVPTGALMMKAIPPSGLSNYDTDSKCIAAGYVPCDGRTLNATTYPAYQNLYNILRNRYGGAGDNFQVPDLRTSRRYIYGQATLTEGKYLPSFSSNTSNTITHSHTVLTELTSLVTNAVAGSHTHSTSYSFNNAGLDDHSHFWDANLPALNATNAVGTTLTKADGTGTAAGAAHAHSTGAFYAGTNSGAAGTSHAHSGSGTSTSYTEPTHTHTVNGGNISIPNSSALELPYINMLYFIKI